MTSFVLRSARVVDMAPGRGHGPEPVDVRVQNGRVVEVGRDLDRPAGVPEHAAAGRWLVPGLWDQHVHLTQWAMTSGRLDLAATRSVEEALALVVDRLRERPDVPVVGWGHRSATWSRPPTVAELDLVSGDRPVALISGDGHHAWLNTAALDALRLPRREDVVAESEWFSAFPRLTELVGPAHSGPAAVERVLRAAAARGVVGVVDLEFGLSPADWVARAPGLLRIRTGTYPDTLEEYLAAGLRTGDPLPGGDGLLTMGPLKIISDGALNTRTAWCCAPYVDAPGSGAANLDPAELRDADGPCPPPRPRGGHPRHRRRRCAPGAGGVRRHRGTGIDRARPADDPRGRAAPGGARLAGQRAAGAPARRPRRHRAVLAGPGGSLLQLRSMLDAGVQLALGSDAPVSPLDPWLAMAAAVHRSADDRPAWHPEQALTSREALAASVDGVGTVHAGAPGDLVLLDADPLDPSGTPADQAARLRSMPVAATWVAGTLVFDAR